MLQGGRERGRGRKGLQCIPRRPNSMFHDVLEAYFTRSPECVSGVSERLQLACHVFQGLPAAYFKGPTCVFQLVTCTMFHEFRTNQGSHRTRFPGLATSDFRFSWLDVEGFRAKAATDFQEGRVGCSQEATGFRGKEDEGERDPQ